VILLAIDPGRDKCGVAVVDGSAVLLHHEVVATAALRAALDRLVKQFSPQRILLGDGTASRLVQPLVAEASAAPLEIVNERHTTERGREAYWRHNPPRGLRRLLPLGLQVPPVPYDDYAAYCMALDHLGRGPA
jgi:hypothetical protein